MMGHVGTFPRRVVFAHPECGYPYDRETAAEHLRVGGEYTVAAARLEAWNTRYRLEGVPRVDFNSVMFEPSPNAVRIPFTELNKWVEAR